MMLKISNNSPAFLKTSPGVFDQVGVCKLGACVAMALHKLEHSPSRTNLAAAETVGPLVADQLDVICKVQ